MVTQLNRHFFRLKLFLFFGAASVALFSCVTAPAIEKSTGALVSIDSTLKGDSLMLAEILPYKIKIDEVMNKVIAFSEQALSKNQPEGLLGDFTADLILKKAGEHCADSCKVDMCVLNNGGLRNPLPKGNITISNIYQLMPFENEMAVLTMKGSDVKDMLEFIANQKGMPVAGLRMKIKNQMASEVMIGNKPFDETKVYTVVTSDYLSEGNDQMTFFTKATRRKLLGKKLRDAIIEYMEDENKKGNSINVKLDGRIQIEQ